MTTQFEFRLRGTHTPDGTLDADDLVAIVRSLQTAATRLGRTSTGAEHVGRPNRDVERVSRLRVGMTTGSTCLTFERAVDDGQIDVDLPDEQETDTRFAQLIEGIADDQRPQWVTASQATAAAQLLSALDRAAESVEVRVDGQLRATFVPSTRSRELWTAPEDDFRASESLTLAGRLEKVDLKDHSFRIRDDVGNSFQLRRVREDLDAGRLVGSRVAAAGSPQRDTGGSVTGLVDVDITELSDPTAGSSIPKAIPLEAIVGGRSSPEPGRLAGISEDESDAFFDAMGF